MTRNEHLAFCKKCTNRSFDPKKGITCKITNDIADFEDSCKDFSLDETVKEETEDEVVVVNPSEIPDDIKEKYRIHSVLTYAIIGGFLLSVICAILWAAITVVTEYQIGYMALVVGLIVGFGIRYFGAGIDPVYRFLGAFYSFLGCALGNLFSQVGFIAHSESLGYFETLSLLDIDTIILLYKETFSPMDVLFYGIAIYEGFKFSVRPIPSNFDKVDDYTPDYSKLRFPLVIVSFLLLSFIGMKLSKGVSGPTTFYYESGEVLSTGEMKNSKLDGVWEYYYKSGAIQLVGSYENDLEEGEWIWYSIDGKIMRTSEYSKGLLHGPTINYYENGKVSDSSGLVYGRLNGYAVAYYDDGTISSNGKYLRDNQDGEWTYYYYDGEVATKGKYKNGEPVGLWSSYTTDGKLYEELEYINSTEFSTLNAWDSNGNQMVTDGNGEYTSFYDDGKILETGMIIEGARTGTWKSYYSNGVLKSEGTYNEGIYKLENSWLDDGTSEVINGDGRYVDYYNNTDVKYSEGLYKNGFKEGYWSIYYELPNTLQQDVNYSKGLLNGECNYYFTDGTLSVVGTFMNDLKQGEWTWYHENGMINCIVNFQDGKKEGIQYFWSENGTPTKQEYYENDILVSEELE